MQSSVLLPIQSRQVSAHTPRSLHATEETDRALPASALKRRQAKEHLFLEGDERRFLFEIVSGAVALYKMAPDGRRQILRFALPGDMIGLDCDRMEQMSAQATSDCVVRVAPFAIVQRAAETSPGLRQRLSAAMVCEMTEWRAHLTAVCMGGATQRVAFLLGRFLEKCGRDQARGRSVDLPVTRLDMGDYLGLTLETVSREMSRLKAMGVIEIERITHVTVKDGRRLEALIEGEDFGCERTGHVVA